VRALQSRGGPCAFLLSLLWLLFFWLLAARYVTHSEVAFTRVPRTRNMRNVKKHHPGP
jgi:hypothetical protein